MAGTPFEEFLSRQKSTTQKGAGGSPFEEFLNRRKAQDSGTVQEEIATPNTSGNEVGWNPAALEVFQGKDSPPMTVKNDPKHILKSQIAKAEEIYGGAAPAASKVSSQASMKNAIDGKGTVQQPITEAEAIRQMAQQTQKEYDEFIQSSEYLGAVEAQKQRTLNNARAGGYAASAGLLQNGQSPMVGSSYAAASGIIQLTPEEESDKAILKEADRRKAEADYWKTQVVTSENMEVYNSWPAEDRRLLDVYRKAEFRGPMGELKGFYTPYQRAAAKEQLYEKYGEETVKKIAETVDWFESEENYNRHQEAIKTSLEKGGVLSYIGNNLVSVPANLVGTFSAPIDYAEQLLTRTGQYPTLNPYSKGNIPNAYVGTVRGETANAIAGEGQEGNIIRKGAALLYQGGMSAVDNIVRVAAGGKFGSLAMAAAGSFGQTVQAASAQGATPEQAIALGVINAGVEAATEYIPLDNLFKAAKAGNLKQLLSNVWKQGMSELTEEEIGLVVTTLAEAAILQEKSSYNQTIQEQMAEGKSYEEAKHFANMQILKEAGETAVVSFISGGLMEGGNELINYTGTKGTHQQGTQGGQEGNVNPEAVIPQKQIQTQVEPSKPEAEQGAPVAATQQGTGLELRAVDKPFVAPGAEAQNETAVPQNAASVPQNADHVTENVTSVPENADRSTTNEHISLAEQMRRNNQIGGIVSETGLRLGEAFETPARGAGVSDGGIQWNGSQSAGEQAGSVAEGTEQAAQRQTVIDQRRATIDRQNRLRNLQLSRISSAELGLPSGTEQNNLRLVPQEYWDTEMGQIASRVYQETGKQVSFVIGPIQIRRGDGRVRNVNGVMYKDRIVVRADHLRLSMEQIADHEAYHGRVDYFGDMLNQEIKRHIVETFSEDEFREVMTKYLQAMRGVYDTGNIQSGEDFELLAKQIQEEVFADAYAGINAFGAGADRFTSAVNERMEQLGVGRQRSQENGVRQTNGPPEGARYSFDGGKNYDGRSMIYDSEIYSYDFLTSQQPMKAVEVPPVTDVREAQGRVNPGKIAEEGIKNALSVGTERAGKVYVKNRYTNRDLWITASAIRHGLSGTSNRILTNARLGSIIGEIAQNAIPINALHNTADGVEGTYALAGYAFDRHGREFVAIITVEQRTDAISQIDVYDATHAIGGRQKRDKQVDTKSQGINPSMLASEISIVDFLKAVKSTYHSILSDDVLRHLGESRNKDGYYSGRVMYSIDDQDGDVEVNYDELDQQYAAHERVSKEQWYQDRLGEAGYQKYQQTKTQQNHQKKFDTKVRDQVRRQVETNKRKLHVEAETAKINQEEQRRLRDETKPTKAKRVLKDTMLNLFSIPAGSRAGLGTMIDSYAERLIKNGSLTEEDRKVFFDRMYDAGVMTVPADEYFSEGRNLLKGGRVYVSDSVRKDFGDDWGDIRRRAFGAGIYLTSDRNAGGIDQWNHELAQELPGLFDSEETDERSILERIVQLAEEGKDEKVSLAEYTARLADAEHIPEDEFLNNMERQMDWALRNFANAAGIEISTKEHAVRQQAATRKQNLKLQATLAAERQERKEKAQRARDRQELRDLQQRTLKQLQWLNKNRNRAPEELKETWDEVLSDIDIYAVGAANEMQWSDKHSATWKDLAQMYKDAMKNDPNFLPSKELERIVTRLDGTKIEDMDLSALNDLYKAAIGLRTEFYNRNNVINDEMQRLFAEVYTDSKNEIEAAPGGYSGKAADKFLNMDQLTPMNVLERMAGWNPDSAFYSMAKQLEKGERDMRTYSVKAQRMLQDFLTEHEDWVKRADGQGKNGIWYEVEIPELIALELGKKPQFGDTITVQMTPAQKVHMYLESKNVDNLRHMTGGRTFPDQKLYSEGKRQEAMAQGKTVRMAPDTVKAIVSDLTAEEMELARILEQYYNSFATQEINKISNVLYGYDKAMGKNYAPIYTNKNYTKTEFGVFDTTAEGVGNLKGRQYAVNPSYNISCFDAFEKHVDQTARFVGMAIPARNWTTLMNWREKNNSTADVITHKWGEEGKRYISDLITTLQGGDDHKTESVSSGVAKLQSNYISAIFGSNPSIVLKQLGSIPMGGAYLGMRNIPTPAQMAKIDRELISKYTSELEWRTMGYSTPETKQLKENPNWTQTNKFYRFAFGGGAITAMDGWAASTLWPWAENKVRNDYPDLEVGTQKQIANGESEFYKKVAEEFEVALARSQSTSDEIHQSTLRKSKNPITKAFTMFRSDSAQTYNAIRQKIGEARYYARTGADKQTVKSANKAVGAAFGGLLLNAVWAEAITFLMALWKHKEDKYAEDDGELTVGSVAKEMTKGMLGSIAGVVTGGEELFEIIGNIVSGDEKWYGIDTPGLEQLNDLLDAAIDSGSGMRDIIAGAFDVVKKKGDLGVYLSRHSGDILGNIKTVAETAAMYFNGLPVSNVEAYLIGALKWISPELGAAYDDVFSDVRKSDLSGLHGNALASRIEDILADRKASNSGDTAQVLAELYEAGYRNVVPSDTPSTVTIDSEEHTLGAYQKQAYEMFWGSIVSESLDKLTSSENFKAADQKTQEKMISYLYTYAGELAKAELFEGYEPNTRDEAIEAFSKVGLDMADFLYVYGKYSEIYNLDKSATLKAVEFAHWVQSEGYTAKQAEVIKEELAYYNMSPASSSRYDKMVDNGVDPDEAYDLTMEMAGLEPLEGETQIADVQRWRLAVDSSYVTATQFSMLKGMMSDNQFGNAQTANTFGVSPDAFVGYYEIRTKYDKDGNGAYNQAEVKAAIDSMGKYHLSTEEKAALWQIVTGTKNAKNNPYSVSVGERVLKYLSND